MRKLQDSTAAMPNRVIWELSSATSCIMGRRVVDTAINGMSHNCGKFDQRRPHFQN
jgi:hypothetical protein